MRVPIVTRRKHRNDYNHGKSGWVAGNYRYRRGSKAAASSKMGRASKSKAWK